MNRKAHFYFWTKCILFFGLIIKVNNLNAQVTIPISSNDFTLLLQAEKDNLLKTIYFGPSLSNEKDYSSVSEMFDYNDNNMSTNNASYTPAGTWNLSEPAIQVTHSDGNSSLELKYVSHSQKKLENNVSLTSIILKDPNYAFQVTLFYKVFMNQNVIEQWTEIEHKEKGNVEMQKYSSANLYFTDDDFYLTTYNNQWAVEMQPDKTKLARGIKTIESKLGTRAMLFQSPNFILSLGKEATENDGNVILGQLAWSGNFKLEFEIDPYDNLRLIAGINPYASEYSLAPNQTFKTPPFIYAISNEGTGEASRNLHSWARKYKVLDGEGERLTLLNNWEATYFDFDENKIVNLFKDAKDLGVDMFLLDDGWFGNKYPRNGDDAGLGDWQENVKKLPHGLGYLVKEAKKEGVKFGIWIEPEMVNPKSELYENHLDWVIRQPERPEVYFRNQLVLDLSNPEVQDFVYDIVDKLFTDNPELAFIKWDCNSVIYNAQSSYLEEKGLPQSHLYVEYINGLYKVLERIRTKYPKVPMMLCSGGGGRADYELLKYFTEFWPSDDTDPLERVFMQWDYSYFYPSITTDSHVTNWGKQPIKYKVDVASMGKLGFDIVANELNKKDLQFCKEALNNYNAFKSIVWHGDQYRLSNPYDSDVAALMYVNEAKNKAVMFNYLVNNRVFFHTTVEPIKLNGLDANKQYKLNEINVYPGDTSLIDSEKIYSGDFLMKVGVNTGVKLGKPSLVIEIIEVN